MSVDTFLNRIHTLEAAILHARVLLEEGLDAEAQTILDRVFINEDNHDV